MRKIRKVIKNSPIMSILISFLCGILVMVYGMHWILSSLNLTQPTIIDSVYNQIENQYYRKISPNKLTSGAINGMLSKLDDPFSDYLTNTDKKQLNDTISGSIAGIGVQLIQQDHQIKVMATIANTPAKRAGILKNDVILKVNGKSLLNKSLDEVHNLIQGKVGTPLKIEIDRHGQIIQKKLVRSKIKISTVHSRMEKNKIGYVGVDTFSTNTADEFKSSLKKLDKKQAKAYIIDVRNNPGGLMDQALKMASYFVKNQKVILKVQDRWGDIKTYRSSRKLNQGFQVKKPVVVLINGESASAAEIFSAALNESNHSPLVGTKSYGKGTVQAVQNLSSDSELKLTIAKWLTPKGRWIHHKGLHPNKTVPEMPIEELTSFNKSKTYQIGDHGKSVKNLSMALHSLGFYHDKDSNTFNDSLKQAVINLQHKYKMKANGVVARNTLDKIEQLIIDKALHKDDVLNQSIKMLSNK